MLKAISVQLKVALDVKLVDELLQAYVEVKKNFLLGGHRLGEVEGGRFCEAAFRILEYITKAAYSPLGRPLDTETLIKNLEQLPTKKFAESVRIHMPRTLRVIYDIRNKRDVAHLADGIDPNLQDATLVISCSSWVLAELIRLYHSCSADVAQGYIEQLVSRPIPLIEDFDGFLKVLNPRLGAGDHTLLLLHYVSQEGASLDDLLTWSRPNMRPNLRRTLNRLVNELALAHFDGSRYFITRAGTKDIEDKRIFDWAALVPHSS